MRSHYHYILAFNAFFLWSLLGYTQPNINLQNGPYEDTSSVIQLLKAGATCLYKPGELKSDLDSAMQFIQAAKKVSVKLNFTKGVGESIYLQSEIYKESGMKEKALALNKQAYAYFIQHKLLKQQGDVLVSANAYLQTETDIEQIIHNLESAVSAYHQANALTDEGKALQNLGDYHSVNRDWNKSVDALERSLKIFDHIKYPYKQGVYSLLDFVYTETGNKYRALKYGLLALKTAKTVKDSSMQLCTIYNRLGFTYFYMQNFSQAYLNYHNALKIALRYHDNKTATEIRLSMVSVCRKLNRYKEALKLLKETAPLSTPVEQYGLATILSFAQVYVDLKQPENAKKYVDLVMQQQKQNPYDKNWGRNFAAVGVRFYTLTKQYPLLYKQLTISDTIVKRYPNLIFETQTEGYWAKADSATGKMLSAFKHLQRYKLLNDSANRQNQGKQLAELQLNYDIDNKNQQVKLLVQQDLLQKARIKNEVTLRYIFIGGIVVLFLFGALMYNRSRTRRLNNKELMIKQAEINNKNVLLETLLSEKEWLLKEIHHRVKNNLQIVISLLNTQSSYLDNEEAMSAIRDSQQRMFAISLIHQKLYQSENLETINMPLYIEELVEYLKESYDCKSKIVFRQEIDFLELDVVKAVPLGLIMNEAISNAVKYAFVNKASGVIKVSLKNSDSHKFKLCVNDNGGGLPQGFNLVESGTLGMNLMRGLAEQISAELEVISAAGVSVCVNFDAKWPNQ